MITFLAPAIRADHKTGLYTNTALAKKYNCHPDTIANVLKRSEDKDVYVRTSNPDNLLIMPYLETGHDLNELNALARQWCDKVNTDVHCTTGEKPIECLPLEGLRELPSIPYYEENTIKVQRDGSVYFRGRVYRVDESLAGCSGEVIVSVKPPRGLRSKVAV